MTSMDRWGVPLCAILALALTGGAGCDDGVPESTMPPPSERAGTEATPAPEPTPSPDPGAAAEAKVGAGTEAPAEPDVAARPDDTAKPADPAEPTEAAPPRKAATLPPVAPKPVFDIPVPPLPAAPQVPAAAQPAAPDAKRIDALRQQFVAIRCAQLAGASDSDLSKIWRTAQSDTVTWTADVRRVLSGIASEPTGELATAWREAAGADCAAASDGGVKP